MAKLGSQSGGREESGALDGAAAAIRGMETDDFWIVASILLIITIIGLFWAFRSLRRARVIEDTPTSRIRSAAQGYVELHGTQLRMEGDPVVAPLTKLDCTWWSYQIERYERSGKNSHWRTIHSGISEACFLIEDDTARCIIDPDEAEVTGATHIVWKGHAEWPTSAPESSSILGFGRYRYTERRMHHGEQIYALGFFHTRGDHMAVDMNSALTERLRDWKRDRAALLQRFDADGDGEISGEEWDTARRDAKAELRDEYADRLAAGGIEVLAVPADGRPFMLSVLPPKQLARRYRWQGIGSIVAFFAAGAVSVFMLTARLG
jgi:E3 Ubiquitin ligase